MRILVCFKIIRDLEHITPQELLSLKDGSLDFSVFKKIIGSYDEAALETALCLAEDARRQNEDVAIHGLTVGECEGRLLENLFPLGFDDLIRIPLEHPSGRAAHRKCEMLESSPPDEDISRNPALVAGSIAAFVKERGGYDLIITGKQTGPGESGLIPRMLASGLGLPCIPEVFSLKHCSRGIRVTSKTDAGQAVMTVTKPAVYAVGEALHPYLRVPTLREKIAAGSKEPSSWLPAGTGMVSNSVQFLKYVYAMPQRQCRMIEGNNTEEKIETLWAYLQKAGTP